MKPFYFLVEEVIYQDPITYFNKVADQEWAFFLDSANFTQITNKTNRYSYIALDPFYTIILNDESHNTAEETLTKIDYLIKKYTIAYQENFPPFQGGAMGYFGYDFCRYLEKIDPFKDKELPFHDIALGFYDTVISFDHVLKKAWIISTGFPEEGEEKRIVRARKRIQTIKEKILRDLAISDKKQEKWHKGNIESNFDRETYIAAVKKAKQYIYEGDIFEVNLSQRFSATLPEKMNAYDLYHRIRKINPAPFSAFLNLGNITIASSSPERFLSLHKGIVESRPIKGTIRRSSNVEQDYIFAKTLKNSEKNNAENIMIVDLMRNDLSKVCNIESIRVPQLCGIESFTTVHHLVSVVQGELDPKYTAIDLLRATFPGGSITGAPKIRAMEIIAELEPHCRGPYCGTIGYIGFNGSLDTSIIIRSYSIYKNTITFHAGGAIVLDSDPEEEYEETLIKANALMQAI